MLCISSVVSYARTGTYQYEKLAKYAPCTQQDKNQKAKNPHNLFLELSSALTPANIMENNAKRFHVISTARED